MTKPLEMIFRNVGGQWVKVSGDSELLADALTRLNIIIDDKTQFARMYDFENNRKIIYRAYNLAKVSITIRELEDE